MDFIQKSSIWFMLIAIGLIAFLVFNYFDFPPANIEMEPQHLTALKVAAGAAIVLAIPGLVSK